MSHSRLNYYDYISDEEEEDTKYETTNEISELSSKHHYDRGPDSEKENESVGNIRKIIKKGK